MDYKPEIVEAMKRVDAAWGSPQFPKFPLLDLMFLLARLIGRLEEQTGQDVLSTWPYVEQGFEQIPKSECPPLRDQPSRGSIEPNVETALKALDRHMGNDLQAQTWINLFANVLGQLCALQGVKPAFFEPLIEKAYGSHTGQTPEA